MAVPISVAAICASLESIFRNGPIGIPSARDACAAKESYKKIERFLIEHFDEIVFKAQEDPIGEISISKRDSGLQHSLRCCYEKKTGGLSFLVSFGTLNGIGNGSEARIKKVFCIDADGGVLVYAQRGARTDVPEFRAYALLSRARESTRLVQGLINKGVKGIVAQTPRCYRGKRGIKEVSFSHLYKRDLGDAIGKHFPKAAVLSKLVQTVTSLHKAGIVHRDLKPENIFLDKHDVPYVGDFGFAVRIGEWTSFSGTFGWMAPESYTEEEAYSASAAGDLWSLGAVMFTVITGGDIPPFEERGRPSDVLSSKEKLLSILPILQGRLRSLANGTLWTPQFSDSFTPLERAWIEEVNEILSSSIPPKLALIVSQLLEEDPTRRMTDDQLLEAWGELRGLHVREGGAQADHLPE